MQKVVLIEIFNVRLLNQVDVKGSVLDIGCIIKSNVELLVQIILVFLRCTHEVNYLELLLFERKHLLFLLNIWFAPKRDNYLTYVLGGFDVEKQSVSIELFITSGIEKAALHLVSVLCRLIIANFPIYIAREFAQEVLEFDCSDLIEPLRNNVENRNQRYETKNHAQSGVQIKVPTIQRWVIFQLIEALHFELRQVAAYSLHLAASLLLIRMWLLYDFSLFDKLVSVEPLFLKNIIEQFLESIRVVVD